MNDPIFRAMRDQMRPSPELLGRLSYRLEAEPGAGAGATASANAAEPATPGAGHTPSAQTRRGAAPNGNSGGGGAGSRGPGRGGDAHRRRRPSVPLLATAAVAAVALVGTVVYATARGPKLTAEPRAGEPVPAVVASPADYDAVYAALEKGWRAQEGGRLGWGAAQGDDAVSLESAGDRSLAAEDSAPVPAMTGPGEYTGTNVQVEGIDEGDIVKTDGRTIFIGSNNEVRLVKAAGSDTAEVARIDIAAKAAEVADAAEDAATVGAVPTVGDLLLDGDVLAVVTHWFTQVALPEATSEEDIYYGGWTENVSAVALLYDVSNPAKPQFLTSLGQDGSYRTSRLADGKLYLVSDYWVPGQDQVDPADPATFTPCVTRDGRAAVMEPADLTVWKEPTGTQYVVLSVIDLASAERVGQRAVLGGGDTVYMSHGNLYLAASQWRPEGLGAFLSQFGIGVGSTAPVTQVVRVSLDTDELTVAAEGTVPGVVVDQFALDEYESNLRIATTIASVDGVEPVRAALFVLSPDLTVIGKIPELMRDETIQSVRFTGPTGYVVTFRQTDPLFALDLADPASPKVMSALKITGFSAYLHPWGEDELIGLGYAGNEQGLTGGLQLVLFDTSDPFDVSVRSALDVNPPADSGLSSGESYLDSDALWDHRAVMADPAKDTIGFPARSWDYQSGMPALYYLLYAHSEASGFELRASLTLPELWSNMGYPIRGLRIGSDLYVVSGSGVVVWDGTSLNQLQEVAFTG
ncbi:MAG: beta-propeller domain-containing protein [Bifidobacteriaceae bacterium]|jgi:uncharacterized secreted protein with C-terminal beta-propeller domain|nr:beta-propeller domain-containing protein [Bifidobacteriaceae bacterium]